MALKRIFLRRAMLKSDLQEETAQRASPPVRPRDPGTMLTRAGAKTCPIRVGGATGLASHSGGLDLGFLLLINNTEA